MFINIKHSSYEDIIPISCIIKFAVDFKLEKYWITLSEVTTSKNFLWDYGDVSNKVIEIDNKSQPLAFSQIQSYLNKNQA